MGGVHGTACHYINSISEDVMVSLHVMTYALFWVSYLLFRQTRIGFWKTNPVSTVKSWNTSYNDHIWSFINLAIQHSLRLLCCVSINDLLHHISLIRLNSFEKAFSASTLKRMKWCEAVSRLTASSDGGDAGRYGALHPVQRFVFQSVINGTIDRFNRFEFTPYMFIPWNSIRCSHWGVMLSWYNVVWTGRSICLLGFCAISVPGGRKGLHRKNKIRIELQKMLFYVHFDFVVTWVFAAVSILDRGTREWCPWLSAPSGIRVCGIHTTRHCKQRVR